MTPHHRRLDVTREGWQTESMSWQTAPLFGVDLPDGFEYRPDFIDITQEAALADAIGAVTFVNFELRGVIARRRVAFFGESYHRGGAEAIPDFLLPLRAAIADWAGLEPAAFAMALINEYRPGAPIGWHRDAPSTASSPGSRSWRPAG